MNATKFRKHPLNHSSLTKKLQEEYCDKFFMIFLSIVLIVSHLYIHKFSDNINNESSFFLLSHKLVTFNKLLSKSACSQRIHLSYLSELKIVFVNEKYPAPLPDVLFE